MPNGNDLSSYLQSKWTSAMEHNPKDSAAAICFGWDRATDERSCQAFVQRFSSQALLSLLTPRLTDQELADLIDHLSGLMKKHLSEGEYHRLFLADSPKKRV